MDFSNTNTEPITKRACSSFQTRSSPPSPQQTLEIIQLRLSLVVHHQIWYEERQLWKVAAQETLDTADLPDPALITNFTSTETLENLVRAAYSDVMVAADGESKSKIVIYGWGKFARFRQ